MDIPDLLCAACLLQRPAHDGVWAAVAYDDVSRAVVLKLKHGRKPGMASMIGKLLQRHQGIAQDSIVAPIPLHRWRLWSRGYNQSLLIARQLRDPVQLVPELLIRSRATPMLKGLGRSERAKVVRGAFSINPKHASQVKGRTICLVDDVFTTGATIDACAKVLKRAGATRVVALCWARVLNDQEPTY
jgi:ComF family protein